MTFGRQDAPDFAQDLVRLRLVFERVRQDHCVDGVRSDRQRIGARADRGGPAALPRAVPREHGLALRAGLGDQAVVVAPQADLQQLPPEHLRQRLRCELAFQRVDALAERRAQPGLQVWTEVVRHAAEG